MNPKEQIIELAKLDGFLDVKERPHPCDEKTMVLSGVKPLKDYPIAIPSYLVSRDAIVPLIQMYVLTGYDEQAKLGEQCRVLLSGNGLWISQVICMTPAQLCEALLRATGKWKD